MAFKITVEDTDSPETVTRVQIVTASADRRTSSTTIQDVAPGEPQSFVGNALTTINLFEILADHAVGIDAVKLGFVKAESAKADLE